MFPPPSGITSGLASVHIVAACSGNRDVTTIEDTLGTHAFARNIPYAAVCPNFYRQADGFLSAI
jgi:hypothetical protein